MHQLVMAGKYCRLVAQAAPFPRVLTDHELRQITPSVLLLLGEHEMCFNPHAALDRAKALMPNLKAELINGVGHALTMEEPEATNARVLGFLDNARANR